MSVIRKPSLFFSFVLFALLPAARLWAGEAADVPETPEVKEVKEAPAAKELTEDDKRAAEELVKGLAAEDFEVRKASLETIRALVFADKTKARAWDAWLEAARKATQDPETLTRLPANVELLHRYAGLYKRDDRPGGDFYQLKISLNGEFGVYLDNGRSLRAHGRTAFSDKKEVVLEGVFLDADRGDGVPFKFTLQLLDEKLSGTAAIGGRTVEVYWLRREELPPAKSKESGKPAEDAAKKEP
ncbi:MAG: hypothetical protein L6R28_21605 [Planctomycetes bacterium]|nr:hypothetical protein [Planctomycetota bacterium]